MNEGSDTSAKRAALEKALSAHFKGKPAEGRLPVTPPLMKWLSASLWASVAPEAVIRMFEKEYPKRGVGAGETAREECR